MTSVRLADPNYAIYKKHNDSWSGKPPYKYSTGSHTGSLEQRLALCDCAYTLSITGVPEHFLSLGSETRRYKSSSSGEWTSCLPDHVKERLEEMREPYTCKAEFAVPYSEEAQGTATLLDGAEDIQCYSKERGHQAPKCKGTIPKHDPWLVRYCKTGSGEGDSRDEYQTCVRCAQHGDVKDDDAELSDA